MKVSKLTITPWFSKGIAQHFVEPTEKAAATLVKERLSLRSDDRSTARIFRKIPKSLKGFVNPQSKVSTERKFTIDV